MDAPAVWADPATGERFVRTGTCTRCGKCCAGEGGPDDSERAVRGMCSLFRWEGPGIGACAGHGTHPFYLLGCDRWPSKPIHTAHIPECGYAWVRQG